MDDTSEQAKKVLTEIVHAAGGRLSGTVRLYKAFYFAHLYYWRRKNALLTMHPIVRMPHGPGVHNGERLLQELVEEGELRVTAEPIGPYEQTVYEAARPFEVQPDDPCYQAIREAVDFVEGRTAAELSELTHEYSRSWRAAADGEELSIYLDVLDDREYETLRSRLERAQTLVDAAFAPHA